MSDPTAGWSAPAGWSPGPAPTSGEPGHGFATPPGWGGHVGAAAKPGVVPLRPLGLGELLDGAVAIVRRYPKPTLGLSAAVAVVTTLLNVAVLWALTSGPLASSAAGAAGQLLAVLVSFVAAVVMTGVLTVVVGKAVLGQPLSTGDAWRAARPHLWRLAGLVLLVAVVGLLLVGVPTGVAVALAVVIGPTTLFGGVPLVLAGLCLLLWVYVRWSLAGPAVVLERQGLRAGLRRSRVLVAGSWWRVLGILLLATVIAYTVAGVVQLPFVAVGLITSGVFSSAASDTGDLPLTALVLTQVGSGIARMLITPFLAAVVSLLYVDRRMRAEGLDVSLAAAAAAPPG